MFMFILEKMVPQLELEVVSASCENVRTMSMTIQKLTSLVDEFDSRLCDLKSTFVLEVGGGVALSKARVKFVH